MKPEWKYGLLFSAAQLLWLIIEFGTGLQTTHKDLHPLLSNLSVIPCIAILGMGIRAKKKELGNEIYFREAFLAGVIISFVAAMLNPVVILAFDRLVNPHFFTDFQHYAVERGAMTIEQSVKYFNLGSYMLQGAIGTMLLGTVASAVVAAIVKNKE